MLTYDSYISYHIQDQQWTEGYLVPHLLAADYHIATSDSVVSLNEPYWTSRARAIQQSRHVLLVVSAAWLEHEWGMMQRYIPPSVPPHPLPLPPPRGEGEFGSPSPVMGAGGRGERESEHESPRPIVLLLEQISLPPALHPLPLVDFTNEQQWKDAMVRLLTMHGEPLPQPTPAPKLPTPPAPPASPTPPNDSLQTTTTLRLLWHKFRRKESL